jgi:hypothetical protein
MTTGSWSFGDFGTGTIAASKLWSGTNGKTEPWQGGTRAKWNSYDMNHRKMSQQASSPPGFFVAPLELLTMAEMKVQVGWSANEELRLLSKLTQEIRGHSFDLGINIAEASKSYSTVVANLRSVGSALWHLKHGRLAQASRVLSSGRSSRGILANRLTARDLTGRWLETQYAFLPLLSQSYEAAKALQAVTKYRQLRFSAKSGARKKLVNMSAAPTQYTGDALITFNKGISAELYEDISLQRSLGLVNPLEIAWELVPYSFVVDWFIPVGTYIAAWGVIPSLRGRFLTTELGSIKRGAIRKGSGMNNAYITYASGKRRETLFRITRTPSSSISIPRPTFNKLPRALSARRILSAVSLIHQRLR